MEFGVLGPLEVRDDGRTVPVGRGKQRALLALLLLHANEVVSTDRLIDELWGEQPPATAATALQVYVSKLRKSLGAGMIATKAPGYTIQLEREQLDLHRFERLLAEGRESLVAGDAGRAARLLEEAIRLWRGDALADLAYEPFAQAAIVRLEELRLAAVEERFEAGLALGRHVELVGELDALVAEQPLRERPRRQLMLALYRCGRAAEALQVYTNTRRAFVEELGIEPSAALQQLERAILNQDPSLDVPAKPAPPEAVEPPRRVEERKLVTALFLDLGVGSAAPEDPELMQAFVERVSAAADEELAAHGGTVERGIADALLAVFGAPSAQELHTTRALDAAAAVRERLGELFGRALAPRMGLESGEIVVAGDESRPTFAGLPITAAARLVRLAAPGEIVVGSRAASAAQADYELDVRDDSFLLRRPRAGRGRERPEPARTFVDRERELEHLVAVAERAFADGEPQLAAIFGEAGVGKSRLVEELRRRMPAETRWYLGRCRSHGPGSSFQPLLPFLRERLGLHEGEPAETARERLRGREILGLALGLELGEELHPRDAGDRLSEAWVELLTESAGEGPTTVVVEDLQWAEEPLLELLTLLSQACRGPLLLLATARPELAERSPSWAAGARRSSRAWLEPLGRDDSERVLDGLAADLPSEAREPILERAGGNPFFLEEAVASLADRGLAGDGDGRPVAHVSGLHVPDSVYAVIAARLDLLAPAEKAALQAGAVVGRTFWDGAVRDLVDRTEIDFRLLVERDFVRRSESSLAGQREYVFKHALTRDVAYSSLPLARRTELHARCADWLERTVGGAAEHAPLVAHQYAEAAAGEPQLRAKAVRWLSVAAEAAIDLFELESAEAMIDQALALADAREDRIEVLRALARARRLRFDLEGFREATERALGLEPSPPVRAELLAQLALDAGGRPHMWRQPAPPQEVERWIEETLELAAPDTPARIEALVARALWNPSIGGQEAREAVALAERLGEPRYLVRAYEARSDVASAAGELEEARSWTDRAVALAPEVADPDVRGAQYMFAANLYLRLGRIDEARGLAAEHEREVVGLSDHHRVHAVAMHLLTDTLSCNWDGVRGLQERACETSAANTATPCQFNWRSLLICALANRRLGEEAEAVRLEQLAAQAASLWGPLRPDSALLRLVLARGERDELVRLLEDQRVPGLWDPDFEPARLDALVALGKREQVEAEAAPLLERGGYAGPFALRALGVVRGDASLVEWAATKFDELGLDWHAAETRALQGDSAGP
jgi:DNA-binding SARP family transcriptional activator/class 3 adenylate cyclase/tetratricopeptide (TPR) repeat protein